MSLVCDLCIYNAKTMLELCLCHPCDKSPHIMLLFSIPNRVTQHTLYTSYDKLDGVVTLNRCIPAAGFLCT